MNGSEWFEQYGQFLGHDRAASMAAVLHAVKQGWDVKWPMKPVPIDDDCVIYVASHYFAIGTFEDYIYVPLDAPTAVAVCELRECILPTRKMVKAIWDAADVRVDASRLPMTPEQGFPRDEDMYDSRRWPIYTQRVLDAEVCDVHQPPDLPHTKLLAGSHKDVVISNALGSKPDERVAIYGWQRKDGTPIQGPSVSTVHIATYYDYSHGVRLCSLRYKSADGMADIKPALSGADAANLSDEGPLIPAAFYPPPSDKPQSLPRTIRRGDRGEEVKVAQTAVGVAADGIFGPLTEEAVKGYQLAHGLTADGIVGPNTWTVILNDGEEPAPPPEPGELPNVPYPAVIPFVQARNYTAANRAKVRWIVIHTMEAAERPHTAENVAAWFAGSHAPMASCHYCVDEDTIVQCVEEKDVAWHAKKANRYGVGIEHAGYHNQGAAGWADDYSQHMLALSAKLCARICLRWGIDAEYLDEHALQAGERTGITYHSTVTKAFNVVGGHIDPGPDFPIEQYLAAVRAELSLLS